MNGVARYDSGGGEKKTLEHRYIIGSRVLTVEYRPAPCARAGERNCAGARWSKQPAKVAKTRFLVRVVAIIPNEL